MIFSPKHAELTTVSPIMENDSDYVPSSSSEESNYTVTDDEDNGMQHDKYVVDNDNDVENFKLQSQYLQHRQKEVYFSTLPAEEAKKKELELAKKGEGHYRSMTDDTQLYHDIMEALKPFMDEDQLKMLWHEYDTNVNEAMNRSVSSFAPKDRTFCRTMSLETRISIAAGVQICGHYTFWRLVLEKHGIIMGEFNETNTLKKGIKKISSETNIAKKKK